jgi:hypothetical protein
VSRKTSNRITAVGALALALFLAVSAISERRRLSQAVAAPVADPTRPVEHPNAALEEVPATQPTTAPAPQSAAPPAPAPGNIASKTDDGKIHTISFQFLSSFTYGPKDGDTIVTNEDKAAPANDSIPDKIKALNGKRVGIQGFMIPLGIEAGKTKEFIVMAAIPGCFFCQPPQLNEFIVVTMKDGKAVEYKQGSPVLVVGKLAVGEERDGGEVTSIYRMEGEQVLEGAASVGP